MSMSKSLNVGDTLYKTWCNMTKGTNQLVKDYTVNAAQFNKDLQDTEKEVFTPEFIKKWKQGFGEILAPINLAIDDFFSKLI